MRPTTRRYTRPQPDIARWFSLGLKALAVLLLCYFIDVFFYFLIDILHSQIHVQ